jgi:2'-5' RNA ligase
VTEAAPAAGGYPTGETGLIATVSEAEPVVGRWRSQSDPAAAAGIPAHVTVMYPFLPRDRVDVAVRSDLAALFAQHQAFEVQFAEPRRFPGVLYLAPLPDAGLRALTTAVGRRWPELSPYGGQFADVVPHLTVAQSQEPQVLDRIEREVRGRLPVTARIAAVQLIVYAAGSWNQARSFSLAGGETNG